MIKKSIKITPYDTPWEVACMLINAEHKAKNCFGVEYTDNFFDKQDLKRIGEHLVNYYNTESESEEE